MPYIQSKFLRIVFIVLFLGSLAAAVGYLKWVQASGEVVATAEPLTSPLNPANTSVGLMRERPVSGIITREQTVVFAPLKLAPEMGEIRLEIKLVQVGPSSDRGRFATQTYTLVDDASGKAVFEKKERGLLNPPTEDKSKDVSIGVKNHSVVVARTTVPHAGTYTLNATIEQWLLASANLSMTLVAKSGTVEADTKIIVAIFGTLLLSIFLLFLTTPPHLRKSQKNQPSRS